MDAQRGKMTWPALYGVEESRAKASALWADAENALSCFGERAWFMREFAAQLQNRKY